MPKISIIIAVYNIEKYLSECLDSLVNQTLTDIEIICVDDGSTDSSLNILKEYQSKDSRIKIIEQKNQGPGAARNTALEAAEGKYVMVVDSDDWLELNACELAYNQIEKNQNDLIIFNYKKYIEKTGEIIEQSHRLKPFENVIDNPNINLAELRNNFYSIGGYTWGKIYNREFLKNNSIKYANCYLCEDIPFLLIALAKSRSISIIKDSLYVYRQREGSAMSSAKRWRDTIESRKIVVQYLIENNLIEPYLRYFSQQSCNIFINYWYDKLTALDSSIKKEFKREILDYIEPLSKYMDKKTKFKSFLFKYNLRGIYFKIIRPIGKYCIVLPYRKIKTLVKGN